MPRAEYENRKTGERQNTTLDGSDMTEFAAQWQTDWPSADYDGDGDVDNDDFELYVIEYDRFNTSQE